MTNENLLSSILDHSPIGILTLELLDEKKREFRLLHVNDYNSKIVGTDLKQFIGKTLRESFPKVYEEDAILPNTYLTSLKSGKEIPIGEVEYEDDNIIKSIFQLRCIPIDDRRLMILTESATEIKEAQNLLQEKQNLLATGEKIASLSTWVVDPKTGETEYTDAYLEIHGFSHDEITKESATTERIKRIHPDDQGKMEKFRKHSLDDLPISEEYRFITPSGEIRWLRDTIAQSFSNGKIIGTTQDITLVRENEFKYNNLNRLFKEIDRLSPAMTYIYDIQEQKNVYANRSLMEELGYSVDDLKSFGDDLFPEIAHPDDLELIYRHHTHTLPELKDTETCQLTYRMLSKKINGYVWLKSYESVFERDETKNVKSIVGLAFDVTKEVIADNGLKELNEEFSAVNEELRVSNEEIIEKSFELEKARAMYEELYNTSPDMMASVDFNTKTYVRANDTMSAELGYAKGELIGLPITETWHPDYTEGPRNTLNTLNENGEISNAALVLKTKNGEPVYVELNGKLVRDEDGKPLYTNSVLRNVTERELLKQALGESKERFRIIANLSPVGIYENDLTGACIYVNEATAKIVGLTSDECLGNGWGTHVHPEDQERAFGNWMKMVEHGDPYLEKIRFIHPDGKLVWTITEARIIKNELGVKTGFMGSIIDVTQQMESEEKFKKANQELNKHQWLLETGEKSAKMGTMIWNIETEMLEYSKEMINIFAFDLDEVNPQNFQRKAFERTHPEDIPEVLESMEFARDSLEPTVYENRIILANNNIRWIRTRSFWLPDPKRMVVSIQDITIEKEHQLALQFLNENLSSINEELRVTSEQLIEANLELENQSLILNRGENVAKIGSFIYNKSLKKFEYTKGFKDVYGIDENIVHGMDVLQASYERILPKFREKAQELFFESLESETIIEASYKISLPNQEVRWVRGVSQIHQNKDTIKGIVQDITDIKNSQLALEKANIKAKEANNELEQFVYSVSHDLRAPIRHVEGYADWLAEDSESFTAKQNDNLEKIVLASNRLGLMIDELLEYSRTRKLPIKKVTLDLNKVVEKSIDSFVKETKERKIDWQVGDLPTIQADANMMEKVFDNLLSNSVKYSSTKSNTVIKISAETRANEILIKVADNGVGFNMKYENKLFSIFQRLHKRSEFDGTGIGLANVHRIISRHGGKIWAEGVVNEGALFYFTIPKISKNK